MLPRVARVAILPRGAALCKGLRLQACAPAACTRSRGLRRKELAPVHTGVATVISTMNSSGALAWGSY